MMKDEQIEKVLESLENERKSLNLLLDYVKSEYPDDENLQAFLLVAMTHWALTRDYSIKLRKPIYEED